MSAAPAPRPSRRVVVTGIGLVTPFGDSFASFADALLAGRTAFAPVTTFDAARAACPLAAEVVGFDPERHLAGGNHRQLNRNGQLATSAAKLALADAGWEKNGREAGLALGTMFGSLRTIAEFDRRALTAGPLYAKPIDFANSVINAAAGQTAIWHGLTGVNATVTGGPAAGLAALAYATDLLRLGRAEAVLAGGSDELNFETLLGFERGGRTSREAPRPFAAGRDGFLLGEGAALLMLEERESARARGAKILAEVVGQANAFDPKRGADEASAVDAAARAIEGALAEAGIDPAAIDAIDAVSAGANGSPAGDRAEALALARVFGERSKSLPVTAVKSMLGEALGASGAYQAAALLVALERGELPGIPGLETLDPELPIGARAERQKLDLQVGLVHAAGFDGHHTALVLARAA